MINSKVMILLGCTMLLASILPADSRAHRALRRNRSPRGYHGNQMHGRYPVQPFSPRYSRNGHRYGANQHDGHQHNDGNDNGYHAVHFKKRLNGAELQEAVGILETALTKLVAENGKPYKSAQVLAGIGAKNVGYKLEALLTDTEDNHKMCDITILNHLKMKNAVKIIAVCGDYITNCPTTTPASTTPKPSTTTPSSKLPSTPAKPKSDSESEDSVDAKPVATEPEDSTSTIEEAPKTAPTDASDASETKEEDKTTKEEEPKADSETDEEKAPKEEVDSKSDDDEEKSGDGSV